MKGYAALLSHSGDKGGDFGDGHRGGRAPSSAHAGQGSPASSPASGASQCSKVALGGRFWALAASDDEAEDEVSDLLEVGSPGSVAAAPAAGVVLGVFLDGAWTEVACRKGRRRAFASDGGARIRSKLLVGGMPVSAAVRSIRTPGRGAPVPRPLAAAKDFSDPWWESTAWMGLEVAAVAPAREVTRVSSSPPRLVEGSAGPGGPVGRAPSSVGGQSLGRSHPGDVGVVALAPRVGVLGPSAPPQVVGCLSIESLIVSGPSASESNLGPGPSPSLFGTATPASVAYLVWLWLPKGTSSLHLGFPASQSDLLRRRSPVRIVRHIPPPPPLSRSST